MRPTRAPASTAVPRADDDRARRSSHRPFEARPSRALEQPSFKESPVLNVPDPALTRRRELVDLLADILLQRLLAPRPVKASSATARYAAECA